MKRLWIVGGGGAALQAWAVVAAIGENFDWTMQGFIVTESPGFETAGLQIQKEPEFLASADPAIDQVLVAIGAPRIRGAVARRFNEAGFRSPVVIHPRALIGPRVTLGPGTIVMGLAALETDVRVGEHGLINQHASVAHEGILGDCVSVGPGVHLAGKVRIGSYCDLGTGAVARPGISVGEGTVVGAGAAIVADHPGGGVLVGIPAKPIP